MNKKIIIFVTVSTLNEGLRLKEEIKRILTKCQLQLTKSLQKMI